MNIHEAIVEMCKGNCVRRANWVDPTKFVWLKPATVVKEEWCHDNILKRIAHDNGGLIRAAQTFCMFHTVKYEPTIVSGWTPDQYDMMEDDWEVVREPKKS